jgi:hypothetical protein
VADGVTSLRLSLVQADECVEVFRLMRLPELDGECEDLTAGVARVNGKAAPGVAEGFVQPFGALARMSATQMPADCR